MIRQCPCFLPEGSSRPWQAVRRSNLSRLSRHMMRDTLFFFTTHPLRPTQHRCARSLRAPSLTIPPRPSVFLPRQSSATEAQSAHRTAVVYCPSAGVRPHPHRAAQSLRTSPPRERHRHQLYLDQRSQLWRVRELGHLLPYHGCAFRAV